jgi:hypothetical protein
LGGKEILSFYQEIPKQNYHFAYVNCNKNYFINKVENLFYNKSTTMFSNKSIFIIHPKHQVCAIKEVKTQSTSNQDEHNNHILEFIKSIYPKQKYLTMLFQILEPFQLIASNLFFVSFPNIHVADVCAFLNNKFGKEPTTDTRFIKLCKYLRSKGIKFPKIAVKNPVAQKYLCV